MSLYIGSLIGVVISLKTLFNYNVLRVCFFGYRRVEAISFGKVAFNIMHMTRFEQARFKI